MAFKTIITNTESLRMSNKKRRCRSCKEYKIAKEGLLINNGFYCDIDCATTYAYKNKEKGREIKHKAQKKEMKENDKSLRTREAQKAFNAFIRQRDMDQPCISCGRFHTGQYHAGHYKSVGACPELRFDEDNCHKQCSSCNDHLSGNIVNYRPNLITKIGLERVERLERKQKPKKYNCEQLKQIELHYKQKLKELKNET